MTLYSKPIKESVNILDENLKEISTVSEWAEFMGYSRSHFSTCFTECFGGTPLEYLCHIRYKRLQNVILKFPHETSRSVAQRLGLADEQALYKFLDRHYDTNFTEVREKLLYGKE